MNDRLNKVLKQLSKKNYTFRTWYNKLRVREHARQYARNCEHLPVNERLVMFESFQGRSYSCSPKAIYEAMKADPRFDAYTFIWVFRGKKADPMRWQLGDERTIVVSYNSKRYFRYLAQAKYWVTNWRLPETIHKRPGQVCIQCWHGTPLKKIGMDLEIEGNALASQKTGHERYLNDARNYDWFVSPSAFCTRVFASAFGLNQLGKADVLIETGYPRNDALVNATPESIAAVKGKLGLPQDEKVLLYAPTWRDNQHELGVGYTFDMGAHIKAFLDEVCDDYIVLLRLHYLVSSELDVSAYAGRVFDYSDLDDINELYLASDILITDYSSVFFDYANLKRPILFYMFDLDEYQSGVRDFYIDLAELPGPIVKTQDELVAAVHNIEDVRAEYAGVYETFNNTYTYLDDGQAGLRVALQCIGGEGHA